MNELSIGGPPGRGPAVVVDTDVYSRIVLPGRGRKGAHPARAEWQEALLGHRLLIAVQTRVELLSMPLLSKSPGQRRELPSSTPTLLAFRSYK